MKKKAMMICLIVMLFGTSCGKIPQQELPGKREAGQETSGLGTSGQETPSQETPKQEVVEDTALKEEEAQRAEPDGSQEPAEASGEVTPDLKTFLDEYEKFMDEYLEFMQKYKDSDNSTAMLYDYLAIMKTYADFAQALENYDSAEMSAADAAYYLEVTTRVSRKMIEAVY